MYDRNYSIRKIGKNERRPLVRPDGFTQYIEGTEAGYIIEIKSLKWAFFIPLHILRTANGTKEKVYFDYRVDRK